MNSYEGYRPGSSRKRSRSQPTVRPEFRPPFHCYYKPLRENSIRLLRILRVDRRTHTVFAKFEQYSLREVPDYYAISHTWVPPMYDQFAVTEPAKLPKTRTLLLIVSEKDEVSFCQELERKRSTEWYTTSDKILLSINISEYFFYQKRGIGTQSFLWIDYICINQKDASEVASQILLMGDVYASASLVIVWLGADKQDLGILEWILKTLWPALDNPRTRLQSRDEIISWLSDHNPFDNRFWREEFAIEPSEGISWEDVWLSYCRFFAARRWFKRAWVVQEITMARDVIVTAFDKIFFLEDINQLELLLRDAKWIETFYLSNRFREEGHFKEWYPHGHLSHFRRAKSVLTGEGIGPMDVPPGAPLYKKWQEILNALLQVTRSLESTYPQDRVFSVLGMVKKHMSSEESEKLQHQFNDAPEVFTWVSKLLIENSFLGLLGMIQDQTEKTFTDLPSWVVDWTTSPSGGLLERHEPYIASRAWQSGSLNSAKVEGTSLYLSAARIGTCNKVVCLERLFEAYPDDLDACFLFLVHVLEAYNSPFVRENVKADVLLETLTFFPSNDNIQKMREGLQVWLRFILHIFEDELDPHRGAENFRDWMVNNDVSFYDILSKPAGYFGDKLRYKLKGRCIFNSSNGQLGNGSCSTQTGDELWLVPPLGYPLVLRPRKNNDEYQFIGAAYLHGIMKGELEKEDVEDLHRICIT